jgi:hypothetical protein
MKQKQSSGRRRSSTKSVLRLPDLEHAKTAVLNSLNSMDAKRGYRHAIDEFVDWYCSKPRLGFNRIVVLRYRSHLETRQLAPGTINLRLGAVRRASGLTFTCPSGRIDCRISPRTSPACPMEGAWVDLETLRPDRSVSEKSRQGYRRETPMSCPCRSVPSSCALVQHRVPRGQASEERYRNRAKFYSLTPDGAKYLRQEQAQWKRLSLAIDLVLDTP